MQLRCVFCSVVFAGVVLSGFAADDKAATPPAPTLAEVLRTNAVGKHTFAPRWVGTSAVVHATGIFKRAEPPVLATNRYKLRFDTLVVTPKSPIGNVGPRGLARADKDGGYIGLHTLRDRLPGDIQLEAAKTLTDLQKLLGPTQGFAAAASEDGERRERVSWSAATLNGDKSLDALQVNALVEKRARPNDAHIHSLEILRGTASPETKKPEDGKQEKKSEAKDKSDDEKQAEAKNKKSDDKDDKQDEKD
jgi:hypothetical protein